MVPSPYGYTQNPDGSKIWVVDPEAAAVVRRIFMLTLDGHGSEQIAAILTSEHVLTPTHYWKEHGVSRPNRTPPPDQLPRSWKMCIRDRFQILDAQNASYYRFILIIRHLR